MVRKHPGSVAPLRREPSAVKIPTSSSNTLSNTIPVDPTSHECIETALKALFTVEFKEKFDLMSLLEDGVSNHLMSEEGYFL